MKKKLALALCLICMGCYRGGSMNPDRWEGVHVGDTISQVRECVGSPYTVKECPGGVEEWLYIERVTRGREERDQRHYRLTVENCRVVEKQCEYHEEEWGPLQFDTLEAL